MSSTSASSVASLPSPAERPPVNWVSSAAFLGAHLVPLAVVFTGVTTMSLVLAAALFFGRIFFITAGYHRYFAHRAYRTNRVFQFILAFGGGTAAQKSALWWAGNHRLHHRYTDTDRDPHSPQMGFWWSHIGWVLSGAFGRIPEEEIEEFVAYPELRFLARHEWIPPWTLGVAAFLVGGWSGLVVGFFASTVVLWHVTFSVNSVCHVWGVRPYATVDSSRNNLVVALLTWGEGWHNNHHHHPASARQGFRWWQIDLSWYVLRALSLVGIVRDLRQPTRAARSARRIRDGHFDVGRLRQHMARAKATITPDAEEVDAALARVADAAARATRKRRAAPSSPAP